MSLSAAEILYSSYLKKFISKNNTSLNKKYMNITFPSVLGLAAGFDKNGDYLNFINNIGLGFAELGTITPKAQTGNKKPRVFRIPDEFAIINHLGFNNKGVNYLKKQLTGFEKKIPIGVNIGKNADTPIHDAFTDYQYCMREIYELCDYITLNISSPNTSKLRDLHKSEYLEDFLYNIKKTHDGLIKKHSKRTPIVLKISPDINHDNIYSLCKIINDYEIDGIILTNTTLDKSLLSSEKYYNYDGGVSGLPIHKKSNNLISDFKASLSRETVIIGCGGIMSKSSAQEKILSGAHLLQIYTGLVYKGLGLIKEING